MSESIHGWVLSGGIGSGKSTVRTLLEKAGVNTIDSDSLGHRVLEPDGPAYAEVVEQWPSVLIRGHIDRQKLGAIVFNDPAQLKALESITHPHIFDMIVDALELLEPPVVVEIPVLDQTLPGEWRRIIVDADDDTRAARLLSRGSTRADTQTRMRAQPHRASWLSRADLVIPNHDSLEDLEKSIREVVSVL